ncbi:hypothetical protein F4778DRAFT_779533 [Xylariomycetidae sp. FL2044]|nr:hypothetical protein F4778DRAFT_779533 [Xylariomycetidae sp. FL2044]
MASVQATASEGAPKVVMRIGQDTLPPSGLDASIRVSGFFDSFGPTHRLHFHMSDDKDFLLFWHQDYSDLPVTKRFWAVALADIHAGLLFRGKILDDKKPFCQKHKRGLCPPCQHNCVMYLKPGETRQPGSEVDQRQHFLPGLHLKEDYAIYVSGVGRYFSWDSAMSDIPAEDAEIMEGVLLHEFKEDRHAISKNWGWFPRFAPQYDEQVAGVTKLSFLERHGFLMFSLPEPEPPNHRFETSYCSTCQLTWLTNERTSNIHKHPSHVALETVSAVERMLDDRSIVVYIDGLVQGGGLGSFGVYFGKDSKYNFAGKMDGSPTKQAVELYAVRHALRIIKDHILPDYHEHLVLDMKDEEDGKDGKGKGKQPEDIKQYHIERPFDTPAATISGTNDIDKGRDKRIKTMVKKASGFGRDDILAKVGTDIRVIFVTDSTSLVDTFCGLLQLWEYDEPAQNFHRPPKSKGAKGKTKPGGVIRDSDIMIGVQTAIEDLAQRPDGVVGVEVVWYQVPKQFLAEARGLAKTAMDG